MARITIEECLPYVPNRFELVILAAQRTRDLAQGHRPLVAKQHDKHTIIALREIGRGVVSPDELKTKVIAKLGKPVEPPLDADLEVIEALALVTISEMPDSDEDES
jgi:DNA-directed RNA polymerase subunit omega